MLFNSTDFYNFKREENSFTFVKKDGKKTFTLELTRIVPKTVDYSAVF